MRFLFPVFLIFLIACSSKPKNKRSVYYWKSTYTLSSTDDSIFNSLDISRVYLRMFDVNWDQQKNSNIPVGIISFDSKPANVEHVPVVYITQSAMINEKDPATLADRISRLVSSIALKHGFSFKELQLDCDWTDGTREAYFLLINKVKANFPGTVISATIRLHQIKYQLRSGIPPVDKGMLMYYNMGELDGPIEQNSIFDEKIADRYNDYIQNYPLQLDLALPTYEWIVQYNRGHISDLISDCAPSDLKDTSCFRSIEKNLWVVKKSHFRSGSYFTQNDLLKLESIDPKTGVLAAKLATKHLAEQARSIALFSWNDHLRRNYDSKQIDRIYTACDQ